MSKKLTPRSTLENLKREAKRWLKALRANAGEARARLARAGSPKITAQGTAVFPANVRVRYST